MRVSFFFFFNDTATTEIYTLSLHDALPIWFILLWLNKPEDALIYFRRAMRQGPPPPSLLLNIGVALTRLNSWNNGRWFLRIAAKQSPDDLLPLFELIENRVRAGDKFGAVHYAQLVSENFSASVIQAGLKSAEHDFRSAPLNPELITPLLKDALKSSVKDFIIQSY